MPHSFAVLPSSSSSAVVPESKYDVFLSFRGSDTRDNFTSHLEAELDRKPILFFIDKNLVRGEEISSSLLKTIEESRLSIVIFSKNYASSRWCLDELVHIMKCKEERDHIVLPVFYGVTPSDVRHQTGSYDFASLGHYKDTPNKVQQWKKALTDAANLSGYPELTSEALLVKEIIKEVLNKLSSISNSTHVTRNLFGMDKRLQEMESLLCLGSLNVRIIGIWGMPGIGKTTLAQSVKDKFSSEFDGSCFLDDIRGGRQLRDVKETMISELLNDEKQGNKCSSGRLRRKKVLLVLDNVTDREQLEYLLGSYVPIDASQQRKDQFGVGSRIILTCRDRHLLEERANEIYEVQKLDFNDARKLFYWEAFKGDSPPENLVELSDRALYYTQGNPLALRVLGSLLRGRSKVEWESLLSELKKAPNEKIHRVMEMSYNRLDNRQKAMFLDIACFLRQENRDIVEGILGDGSHIGINILVENTLLSIKDGKVFVHDLLHQTALKIIQQQYEDTGRHSRLCNAQDAYYVLKNNKGTAAIQGISLDLSKIPGDLCLSPTVFEDMCNLRFLIIIYKSYMRNSKSINVPKSLYLPDSLRYLEWSNCPLTSLPPTFELHNLVKLDMSFSRVTELWNGEKRLGNLKDINLASCKKLRILPDLSQAPKLENLILDSCKSLRQLPNISTELRHISLYESGIEGLPLSFGFLNNIVNLGLTGCKRLISLSNVPANIEWLNLSYCKRLESISSDIWKLKSLNYLELSMCSALKVLPEISVCSTLKNIRLDGAGIEELPSSIENITGLTNLDLSYCKNLKFLPNGLLKLSHLSHLNLEGFSKLGYLPSVLPPLRLVSLELGYCNIQEIPDSLGSLSSLLDLDLKGNSFEKIPSSIIKLDKLSSLNVSHCKNLRHLPELPSSIYIVDAGECTALQTTTIDTAKTFKGKQCEYYEFRYYNCLKMEQSAKDKVFIEFSSRIYHRLTSGPYQRGIKTCYPGNEIPKWFSQQWEGSAATIKLPPNWLSNKFPSFTAYVVVLEFDDSYNFGFYNLEISAKIHFKTNSGENNYGSNVCFTNKYGKRVFYDSDHVFMWYSGFSNNRFDLMDPDLEEASVEFFCDWGDSKTLTSVKVKKCGINVINPQEVEEERPISRDSTIVEGHSEEMILPGCHSSNMGLQRLGNNQNSTFAEEACPISHDSTIAKGKGICLDIISSIGSHSKQVTNPGCHDSFKMEFQGVGNDLNSEYSTTTEGLCLDDHLRSELPEEPTVITDQPQSSGTETINSDAEESSLQRNKHFNIWGALPFLSIFIAVVLPLLRKEK